jgi:hypothetical protein
VLAGVPVGLAVDDPVRRIKPWPSARPGRRLQAQAVCGGDPSVVPRRLPANPIDVVARLSAATVLIGRE